MPVVSLVVPRSSCSHAHRREGVVDQVIHKTLAVTPYPITPSRCPRPAACRDGRQRVHASHPKYPLIQVTLNPLAVTPCAHPVPLVPLAECTSAALSGRSLPSDRAGGRAAYLINCSRSMEVLRGWVNVTFSQAKR